MIEESVEENVADTLETDCEIFKPESVSGDQYDFTSSEKDGFWTLVRKEFGDEAVDAETQWIRDYLELAAEVWIGECAS